MKELNSRLKSGRVDKAYVFYGSEPYLVRAYEKRLRAAVFGDTAAADMNAVLFEGDAHKAADIATAAETAPFLADRRLIVIKNAGLLQTGRKADADALADYLPDAPCCAVLLFLETERPPDKRGRLYKKISEIGLAVEFSTPNENELTAWLIKLFHSRSVALSKHAASAMLRHIGPSENLMDRLYAESEKLIAYVGGRGEAAEADIVAVCTQSVEGRVFGLVKEIGSKNPNALSSFANLLAMKESPLGILAMIARQFRLMLICGGLRDKGHSSKEIMAKTGLRDFMVGDFLRQSANFTQKTLACALADCLDAEMNVKTGRMGDRLAVEMLIVKYCCL